MLRSDVVDTEMKTRILAIFLVTVGVTLADDQRIPIGPKEIAAALRPSLQPGWACSADDGCLVVKRMKPVTMLHLASLPLQPDHDKLVREYGRKTDYMLVFIFRPRLSRKQLAELRAARSRAIKGKMPEDAGKHLPSVMEKRKYVLPSYFNSHYSIYFHRTDSGFTRIYPEEAARERDAILDTLSKWMAKHEDHNK